MNNCTFEDLENARKEVLKKKKTVYLWVVVAFLLSAFISFIAILVLKDFGYAIAVALLNNIIIFAIVFSIYYGKGAYVEYVKKYKEYFVLKGLKDKFEDVNYIPDQGFDKSVIKDTGMMTTGDRYSANDYIGAKYKNIGFHQSDVLIEEEYRDDDTVYYVTIFRGRWLIFDFNKEFKANVQVCDKHFCGARRGGLFSKTKYKKIKMESIDFNEKFLVYAVDEHDAFYILTPSLMEKIEDLKEVVGGSLLLCFIDNKLHIGLNNHRDSFEPPTYKKPINEELESKKVSYDISVITAFVDALDLDNDLFKKEV